MKWTQDNVWKECLAMWKWIADDPHWLLGLCHKVGITKTKRIWFGFQHPKMELTHDCFFCEAVNRKGGWAHPRQMGDGSCVGCPGRLVDPEFNCEAEGKEWYKNPVEFYKELKRLDRKRRMALRRGK